MKFDPIWNQSAARVNGSSSHGTELYINNRGDDRVARIQCEKKIKILSLECRNYRSFEASGRTGRAVLQADTRNASEGCSRRERNNNGTGIIHVEKKKGYNVA